VRSKKIAGTPRQDHEASLKGGIFEGRKEENDVFYVSIFQKILQREYSSAYPGPDHNLYGVRRKNLLPDRFVRSGDSDGQSRGVL
jgi:hypothetical protein